MDEAVWKDPDEFRPERWLVDNPDAPMFTYGLGYRKQYISLFCISTSLYHWLAPIFCSQLALGPAFLAENILLIRRRHVCWFSACESGALPRLYPHAQLFRNPEV
jgi:hypothetical protein